MDLAITETLIFSIILVIVMIPLSALLLLLTTKIFKLQNQTFKTAIIVVLMIYVINVAFKYLLDVLFNPSSLLVLIFSIISWILISFLFAWWLIKKKYNLRLGESFLVWLVWTVFGFILGLIISSIISGILLVSMIGELSNLGNTTLPVGKAILSILY